MKLPPEETKPKAEETGRTHPQCSSEFWINNFDFEIFFDLNKHFNSENSSENSDDQMRGMDIDDLPTEMLSRIFSYCDVIDLLSVQSVCRRWHDVIQSDRSLWNSLVFNATDLDVKTTISLLQHMPLLRSVQLCVIHSADDMRMLISALCEDCWDVRSVQFPESCDFHPSAQDLYNLGYYFPKITSLHLATKQKLTPEEMDNIGKVLSAFRNLRNLSLNGFYWTANDVTQSVIAKLGTLKSLHLPSLPGIKNHQLQSLTQHQHKLEALTLNIVSLTGKKLLMKNLPHLKHLKIIENSNLTKDKLLFLKPMHNLKCLHVNLSNTKKHDIIDFFTDKKNASLAFLEELDISNCKYSDELLKSLTLSCKKLVRLIWHNPKDKSGEMTDLGLGEIIKNLKGLEFLDVKSRSLTKLHHNDLALLKSLRYVRVNGMKVPRCA